MLQTIKNKVRSYIAKSSTFSYLDNNEYHNLYNRYELLAACQPTENIKWQDIAKTNKWVFGHLNFEHNQFQLQQQQSAFDSYKAFVPAIILYIPFGTSILFIESNDENAETILTEILHKEDSSTIINYQNNLQDWTIEVSKRDYIQQVEKIRKDIYYGKYYELNYCVKAVMNEVKVNPEKLFQLQNQLNPMPFSAFYRNEDNYLICGSPERFLYKNKKELITQPIKGTAKKGINESENEVLKFALLQNEKERAENVMIVDLSRNDLAMCSEVGTIEVPELFGIYSFPFVHQMISTIKGIVKSEENFNTIFQKIFPMGSMTGAPKKTVVAHIQQYEKSNRGIYSGTVFYKTPDGDFDSNVVIRSLVYNTTSHLLSYHTGSAITYGSKAEKEWEELQWKAKSMQKVVG